MKELYETIRLLQSKSIPSKGFSLDKPSIRKVEINWLNNELNFEVIDGCNEYNFNFNLSIESGADRLYKILKALDLIEEGE